MGSASLVILSFAFIIFFIYKKINICEWVATETIAVLTNIAMLYLNIDEIVEWVNVLLHKPFNLKTTTTTKNCLSCRVLKTFLGNWRALNVLWSARGRTGFYLPSGKQVIASTFPVWWSWSMLEDITTYKWCNSQVLHWQLFHTSWQLQNSILYSRIFHSNQHYGFNCGLLSSLSLSSRFHLQWYSSPD